MAELDVPAAVDPSNPAYVENPITGERFLFHSTPDDPAIEPLELDLWAAPEMSLLPEHVHPKQDETFTMNAGTIEVSRSGVDSMYDEGAERTIDAGTPHVWTNAGEDRLHLTVHFQPGLATGAFLRDLASLAQGGEVKRDGAPSVLRVAALYDAYGYDVLHLASPPLPIQKGLFGLLAPIARRLGYRAKPVENSDSDRR